MIIIPDIHGRSFWKDAVKGRENEKIIFLGDYTDPYSHEGIEFWEGLQSLREVIEFKKYCCPLKLRHSRMRICMDM